MVKGVFLFCGKVCYEARRFLMNQTILMNQTYLLILMNQTYQSCRNFLTFPLILNYLMYLKD